MDLKLPFTEVKTLEQWANYHGTFRSRIATYCTPDAVATMADDTPSRLRRHGAALQALLKHCFDNNAPLRVMGARWSLSNIIEPSDIALDPANLNVVLKVKPEWVSADYRQRKPGTTPMFVQGGTHISSLNNRLGQIDLALQTSGASNGHRIAGCIATGSHGSALSIGAVHDTVLALHLITGPNRSVLLQPAEGGACTDDVAGWLAKQTGIPTMSLRHDGLFGAALVGLGSLGIVHGVVVEAVPLYRLSQRKLDKPFADASLWNAIRTLDTSALHPDRTDRPYHFEVVFNPYPSGSTGAHVVLMWKEPRGPAPYQGPMPIPPQMSTDAINLISDLSALLDGKTTDFIVRQVVTSILNGQYKPGNHAPVFPGDMFGPTGTPPGDGLSTEIVVDHAKTAEAVDAVFDSIREEATHGRHLLGAVSLRFVPRTHYGTLAMNIGRMNTFIEIPSAGNDEVRGIYTKIWNELERRKIPFTCHWGQVYGLSRARLDTYFGDRVKNWLDARDQLLPEQEAKRVFGSKLLASVGLSANP